MECSFQEEGHIYRDAAGVILPSVTTVINAVLAGDGARFAQGNEEAMDRGRKVHAYCRKVSDLLATGVEIDDDTIDPLYVAGWLKFLRDTGYRAEAWEVIVAHKTYRYAGRFDTLGTMGKRKILVDIKSGSLPDTVGIQLAAYAEASGIKGLARFSVTLPGNGTYRLTEWKEKTDFAVFVGALNVYQWRKKRGGRT